MSFHRVRGALVSLALAGLVVMTACGGSDDESDSGSEVTTNGANSGDTEQQDPAAAIAAFCKSALDNQGGADISADDDAAAIAEKLSNNATSLEEMASIAPEEIKADTEAVAAAARGMADAISSDPTLDAFNALIEQFATSDANTASEEVQTWVADNCEVSQ